MDAPAYVRDDPVALSTISSLVDRQARVSTARAVGALKRPVNEVMPETPILGMMAISRTIVKIPQSDDLQEGIRADKEQRRPNRAIG
jgi:hypothetical protein